MWSPWTLALYCRPTNQGRHYFPLSFLWWWPFQRKTLHLLRYLFSCPLNHPLFCLYCITYFYVVYITAHFDVFLYDFERAPGLTINNQSIIPLLVSHPSYHWRLFWWTNKLWQYIVIRPFKSIMHVLRLYTCNGWMSRWSNTTCNICCRPCKYMRLQFYNLLIIKTTFWLKSVVETGPRGVHITNNPSFDTILTLSHFHKKLGLILSFLMGMRES